MPLLVLAGWRAMLIREGNEALLASSDVPAAQPSAVPDGPASTPSRIGWVPDAITMAGGLLCAGVGVAVMVSWFARATAVLRFGSQTPMSFNTALALAVTGIALVALVRRWPRAALVAGVFDAVLGTMVLTEYALGRNLGIDQLVVKAYLTGPHNVPGRMAVNTALCVTLAGAALLAWGPWRPRRRPTALAAGGSVIGAIAVVATFGYATSNPAAYGWGHVTVMSFLTAATMLILALSMLSAAWQDTSTRQEGLPKWLPMPAGVLALGLAAGVWRSIAGQGETAGHVAAGTVTGAGTVLGLVMAGLVVLVVWLAQRAEGRRRVAVTEGRRRSAAERVAREGEHRLFQFLDAMPVGVFIASPGGKPYYANDESERLLGRGIVSDIGGDELAEIYSVFQAGRDRQYPAESLPIVRALLGPMPLSLS